ncbi:cupin domain-containing protein [uncultured Streptomyces sp.]|uniref:cupin domain-containing protein n=1 Tax=uncultured Streptomyces sp. TaxID=174707 RepID=UPI00261098C6|nr:cupin domain-containing protein [uncultured Streptomyces sp.]
MVTAEHWIETLGLEEHVEGGYFRRTFQADHRPRVATPAGERHTLTSIFYLLTRRSPVGHWHLNRSDVLHFHHHGDPITYHLLLPDGGHRTAVLGQDPDRGQVLTLAVPGGIWKASHLTHGDHGLISEAVSPGFDYADMTLGRADPLLRLHPDHGDLIRRYCAPDTPGAAPSRR